MWRGECPGSNPQFCADSEVARRDDSSLAHRKAATNARAPAFAAMMKPILALHLLMTASCLASDPTTEWVFAGGGASNDKTRCIAVDQQNNVFLAGETTGDGDFGDVKRSGSGKLDFCLVKLSSSGKAVWVRSIGGSEVERGYGVATDAAGNAYVTGHFQSTDIVIDGSTLPNAGDYDIFVAKYSGDGELKWIRTAGGPGYDYGHAIAVDGKGDVIVAGGVGGDSRFGDRTLKGPRALFCAKYDTDGNLVWLTGTTGKAGGSAHGVAVDGAGNIYLGGLITGDGFLGALPLTGTATSMIVARLTPAGEAKWAQITPGAPSALAHEITCDAAGRVWVAGMFKGRVSFGGHTFESSSEKDSDGFVVHYDTDGRLHWATHLQGPAVDYCLGIATNGKGEAYATGEFSETATLGGRSLTTRGGTDIFTAAFGAKGDLIWITQSGGTKSDNAYTMTYSADGSLVSAGACAAPADFGRVSVPQSKGSDLYAAKLRLP